MAHTVIHSLRRSLAPGCMPLFNSNGLNLSFYAALRSFWTVAPGGSARAHRAPVAGGTGSDLWSREKMLPAAQAGSGQPRLRLGTEEALKAILQGLGFSVRLNTAFIERVNLTVRHGMAALARRTWATAKPVPHLLAHLEWWRAYYHGCRVLTTHCEWHSCSRQSEGANC